MNQEKAIVGFIGSGGIARSHAFSLNSLRYYYNNPPHYETESVCSAREESRLDFAAKFGFNKALSFEKFIADEKINTVYILGPNKVHFEHLNAVIGMNSIRSIYLEKPVCTSWDQEKAISELAFNNPSVKIQVGFQFVFVPAIREALTFWRSGIIGKPIHFELKYYHGDYLKKEYRDKRSNRLTTAPDGGAMADLGSHAISMALAFMGNKLQITSASQAGFFGDVPYDSDLFSRISLFDESTHASGTLSASRISSGTGDLLAFEFFGEKGAIKYCSHTPDYFEYYLEETGTWTRQISGSNYNRITGFPSGHVPPGWLRSMIHAHYVFLTESAGEVFLPDITHGLEVQRLVRQTAEQLNEFRKRKAIFI